MYPRFFKCLLLLSVVITSFSCVNSRTSAYFLDVDNAVIRTRMEDTLAPVIQKNDILNVIISSLNAEASAMFNLNTVTGNTVTSSAGGSPTSGGYLVNSDGDIQLPILGKFAVVGLTSKEVKEKITETIIEKKLLIDPIVSVRHINYEVTVIGEVAKPSVISVPSEKISMLKALGLAGDITIYGRKENVLLIREINGKRTVRRINLNSADFLTSPFYYLQPNDVVYVEANKNKVATASALRQMLPIVLSGVTIILITLDRFFD